ncbi:MAG: DEAD/DEAH box helicase [Sphingobacteriaceae bacterium]|nr:MAG: DEAD/DEAH box helicase [Sphingobacteriaceae bacterium]
MAFNEQKDNLLIKIFADTEYQSSLIFCSRKETVKKLEKELHRRKINAVAFHSDLQQEERETIMQDFKNRKIPVLVGTDVLSRGIDVEGIDLVLNYDVPPDPEDYIHRIGRTARAQRTGTAITFISPADVRRFTAIESMMGRTVDKLPLPEGFGPAPEFVAVASDKRRFGPKRKWNSGGQNRQKPRN